MVRALDLGGLSFAIIFASEFCVAWGLTGLPALGKVGKKVTDFLCHAPGLDIALSIMIWIPWVLAIWLGQWPGFIGCLLGQMTAMQLWVLVHERIQGQDLNGPRIQSYLNQKFGWWRNQAALWVTAIAVPIFFLIRLAEIILYPVLVALLGFKCYEHRDWINVSRHKFEGLVGADLIWCLYCDWMTGVYSLGAEMLRNVESFWCPIRFYYNKKCENCSFDFPDIQQGWVAADGTLKEVVRTLDAYITSRQTWSWFGDPDRTPGSTSTVSDPSPDR